MSIHIFSSGTGLMAWFERNCYSYCTRCPTEAQQIAGNGCKWELRLRKHGAGLLTDKQAQELKDHILPNCKSFTTEKPARKSPVPKPCAGQMTIEEVE